MRIEAENEIAFVEHGVRHIIDTQGLRERRGESVGVIGFRTTAGDLAGLLIAVLEAVGDEADAQGFAIRDVEVSGVMPIAKGLRCWGIIDVAQARLADGSPDSPPAPITRAIHGTPVVYREGGMLVADIALAGEEV